MIYGTGNFIPRDYKYVVRRDGVASAFLYLGPTEADGTPTWVEDLSEAAVFSAYIAERIMRDMYDAFDGSVQALTTGKAAQDHAKQLGIDLSVSD